MSRVRDTPGLQKLGLWPLPRSWVAPVRAVLRMQKWRAAAMERTSCVACGSYRLQVYLWSCWTLAAFGSPWLGWRFERLALRNASWNVVGHFGVLQKCRIESNFTFPSFNRYWTLPNTKSRSRSMPLSETSGLSHPSHENLLVPELLRSAIVHSASWQWRDNESITTYMATFATQNLRFFSFRKTT